VGAFGVINGQTVFIDAADFRVDNTDYMCYVVTDEYRKVFADCVEREFEEIK
jgi:hypothetical protein